MSWGLTVSGSQEAVLQAVRDFSPPPSIAVPDPKKPQEPDPTVAQAERAKSYVIGELLAIKGAPGTVNLGMSGTPGGYVSVSFSYSAAAPAVEAPVSSTTTAAP